MVDCQTQLTRRTHVGLPVKLGRVLSHVCGFRRLLFICGGALMMLLTAPRPLSGEQKPKETEPIPMPVSYVEIARQSILNGEMDRAVAALAEARSCWQKYQTACGFSRVHYQALLGVVYLEHHHYDKAVVALEEVVREEPTRTAAWLYLGQSLYYLKRYPDALRALRNAVDIGKKLKGYHVLIARTELALGDAEAARRTLVGGLDAYPGERTLLRDLTLLYTRYGFFHTAVEIGRRYLDSSSLDVFAYLLVADAMRSAGAVDQSLSILEEAHLMAPHDNQVLARLAFAYAEADKPYPAALLFERLARRDGKYAFETAEQYRILGRPLPALRWNARVVDPKKRVTQRLATLLGDEKFLQAANLVHAAEQAGALDDPTRYRLAFAAIRSHRLETAGHLLASITAPALESGKKQLQNLLEQCIAQPSNCP